MTNLDEKHYKNKRKCTLNAIWNYSRAEEVDYRNFAS